MKRKLCIALMLVLMLLMLVPWQALAQETVATGVTDPMSNHSNRKSFDAQGLSWIFYTVSGTIYFKTSADKGATWSGATSTGAVVSLYEVFDIALDGNGYCHLIWRKATSTYMLQYMRGLPSAAGSITWGTQYDTGFNIVGWYSTASIAVDAAGYPWILYGDNVYSDPYVRRSLYNDGTWSTDASYSANLLIGYDHHVKILSCTSGMVALFTYSGGTEHIYADRWISGSSWGAPVPTDTHLIYNGGGDSMYSAVAQDDTVHVVWIETTTQNIVYQAYDRSTNSWGTKVVIQAGVTTTSCPIISKDASNNLHVFWLNSPTDDHVFYAKYIYDTSTWVGYYDLVAPDVDGLPASGAAIATDENPPDDKVGVYYKAGTNMLKFKLLDEVFHVDTLDASPIGATTATLRGEIVSLGFGSATERGFWINDTPSLSGATLEGNETGTFNVGVFTHGITGLTEGYKYYYCAYASNDYGLEYGTWSQFTAGGSAGGITVLTLDPTDVGDFEATFNGNIVATGGDYLSMRGFQWGFSDTPTWLWDEGGNFTVGLFSYTPTDLEADSIYYVRAIAGNGTDTDYGQWIGFITEQPSYVPGEGEIGNDTGLLPPLPEEPGGWIRPPKDWGSFNDIPWTFVMFLVSLFFLVAVGLALTKYTRSLAVTFMVLGFFLGVLCFWPKGGYLDWWVLFPYALVGWALLQRQSESPIAE